MEKDRAKQQLEFIHQTMEESHRFTNIPSFALVGIGLLGLTAGLTTFFFTRDKSYSDVLGTLIFIWLITLLLAVSAMVVFTAGRAEETGQSLWIRPVKLGLAHFGTLLLLGAVLTFGLMARSQLEIIPSVWLLCYGAGLSVVGSYSVPGFKPGGYFCILLGTASLFIAGWIEIALTLGFGLTHIVLAWYVHQYFEAKPKEAV